MSNALSISPMVLEGLNIIGVGDLLRGCRTLRQALVILDALKEVEDTPARFPKGKWATIQHLEEQVQEVSWGSSEGGR